MVPKGAINEAHCVATRGSQGCRGLSTLSLEYVVLYANGKCKGVSNMAHSVIRHMAALRVKRGGGVRWQHRGL